MHWAEAGWLKPDSPRPASASPRASRTRAVPSRPLGRLPYSPSAAHRNPVPGDFASGG